MQVTKSKRGRNFKSNLKHPAETVKHALYTGSCSKSIGLYDKGRHFGSSSDVNTKPDVNHLTMTTISLTVAGMWYNVEGSTFWQSHC